MSGFFKVGAIFALLSATSFAQFFCGIVFSNPSSSIVILPSGSFYLGETDSITGWSRQSILQSFGNNSPQYWDPSWTGTQSITYNSAPVPDLPENPGTITLQTYYYELTEDLFLGPNRNLIIEPSKNANYTTNSNYTFINGNGYKINLAQGYQNLIQIAPGQTVEIGNAVINNYDEFGIYLGTGANLSFINSIIEIIDNQTFTVPLNLSGQVSIDGYGYTVSFNTGAGINLTVGQLTINNLNLYGVAGQNINCATNDCNLVLQNCNLFLTDNYRYKYGGLQLINSKISGIDLGFNYESSLTCSISRTVTLDTGITFSYSPTSSARNLIAMDLSSILYMNGCTIASTTTGVIFTNGTLIIDGQNKFYNTGAIHQSQAIMFGNGNLANDFNVAILPGARLELMSGLLVCNNV
jgi:hypothetical protein